MFPQKNFPRSNSARGNTYVEWRNSHAIDARARVIRVMRNLFRCITVKKARDFERIVFAVGMPRERNVRRNCSGKQNDTGGKNSRAMASSRLSFFGELSFRSVFLTLHDFFGANFAQV